MNYKDKNSNFNICNSHGVEEEESNGGDDDDNSADKDIHLAASYTCVYNLVGCPAGIVPVTRLTISLQSSPLST